MDISKAIANRGVERNKKPLRNIVYEITVKQLRDGADSTGYARYKFKDLGYLVMYWWFEGKKNEGVNFHGLITVSELKQVIGVEQYSKFCQGKRIFIMQRRVDGKNISKRK